MALTHPGIPVWDPHAENIRFDHTIYPEYATAQTALQSAAHVWHNAVDSNEALRGIHDEIKGRTRHLGAAESRRLLANAQSAAIGGAGFVADPAVVEELKRAYASHVGPEMTAFAEAHRTIHAHHAPLLRSQLDVLRNATTLPGMVDAIFLGTETHPGGMKTVLIQRMEEGLAHMEAASAHVATYLEEMPALRGIAGATGHVPPPPPRETLHTPAPPHEPAHIGGGSSVVRTLETLEQKATHTHNKWAIGAIVVAAGLGVGAYIFNQKKKPKPQKPDAEQKQSNEQQWVNKLNAESLEPTASINK